MRDKLLLQLGEQIDRIGQLLRHRGEENYVCLSPALDHVVMVLGFESDLNIKQLAAALKITSGAATQHVQALEEQGLLQRLTDQDDRRRTVVRLTPTGRKAYVKVIKNRQRVFRVLFENLSDHELEAFVKLVQQATNSK